MFMHPAMANMAPLFVPVVLATVLFHSAMMCAATDDSQAQVDSTPRLLGSKMAINPFKLKGKYKINCCEMDPLWSAAKGEVRQIVLPAGNDGHTITYNVEAVSKSADSSGVKLFSLWVSSTYSWKGEAKTFPRLQFKCWPKRNNPQNNRCNKHCYFHVAITDDQQRKITAANLLKRPAPSPVARRLQQDCSAEACGLLLGAGVVGCITACVLSGPFYLVCAEACVAFVSPGLPCCIRAIAGNCFPASATAHVHGFGPKRMDQLRIGDRVRTIDAAGNSAYEEVYLFGHRDSEMIGQFQRITVDRLNRTLTLSNLHFMPRATLPLPANQSPVWGRHEFVYAKDVRVGDTVWVWDAQFSAHMTARVTAKRALLEEGQFNPLTLGGRIEVDGVVASCHSDWFLDAHVPDGVRAFLPALYQGVLAPVRACYAMLGAERMAALDRKFKFAEAGAEGTLVAYMHAFWLSAKSGFQ